MRKILSILTITTAMVACGQTSQNENQNAWKTFAQHDFTIQYPDNFELNTSGQFGTRFALFSKDFIRSGVFCPNINLIIQNLTGHNISLDDFVEISESQIETIHIEGTHTNGSLIESERIKKDNSEFQKIIYTFNQGALELIVKQYLMIKNEKAYILTFTARIDQFDNYKDVATEIMNTFELK